MNIGTLTIEMAANVARLRSDMQQAQQSVNGAMANIRSMASAAAKALAAIGGALAGLGFAAWVKEAIDAADATSKMAQKVGLAVKQIAGLEMAFRQSDLSAEEMQKTLGKLAEKTASGSDAFKAMGISTKAADGSLKSTRVMLSEVAEKFTSYRDGTEKSALALELFGKAGLASIPLLNSGAAALDEYDKTAKELGLTLSDEAAKSAEEFNDTLDTAGLRVTGLATQVASRLLPQLVVLATQVLESAKAMGTMQEQVELVGSAFEGLIEVGRFTFETIAVLAVNVAYVIKAIGNEIGGVVAVAQQMAQFNIGAAFEIRNQVAIDGAAAREEVDKTTARILNARKMVEIARSGLGQDERRFMDPFKVPGMDVGQLKAAAPVLDALKKKATAAKSEIELLKEAFDKLQDKIIGKELDIDPEFYKNIEILNKAVDRGLISAERRLELYDSYAKKQKFYTEQLKAEEDARKANIEIIEKENELLNRQDEAKRDSLVSLFDTVEAMEFENSTLFMTNEQRKMSIFLRDMENKGIKEGSDEYKMLADRMAGAIKSETFLTKWKDITTKIGDSLVDAIVDGGANAADMLRDMFKSLVLRPVVSAIVGSLGLGGAGGALAAGTGGVGEALGLQNTISTLSNLYSTATGSFAKIATSVGGMATDVGVWMAEMGTTTTEVAGTIMADSSSLMATAGEGLIDASSAIGSAASSLAGLYAGYAIGNAISGNKSLIGGNPSYTTGGGALIGAAVGSFVPVIGTAIGAVLGGALGGVLNRAFGMGERVDRDSGLTGRFTSQGADMQNFQKWDQEGGWFRSDKSGTDYSGIGGDLQNVLDTALKATASTVKGYVELLGLNSDAIAGFSQELALGLNGMSGEEAQKRIAQAIADFGNFMIESLFSEVGNLRKRGETAGDALLRLSTSLKSVNSVFTVLHLKLMDVSVAGADASSKLIDAFGGMENFAKATDFYYQNFFTEAERTNNTVQQLAIAFKALGLEVPATKDAFKAMVTAARDANNTDLFAALLALAPTFESLQKAAENVNNSLQQQAALERELLTLNGDAAALAALDRAEISANNLALYDRIVALKATQAAEATAAQAALEAAEKAAAQAEAQAAKQAEDARIALDRARVIADEKLALEDRLADGANDVARARSREMNGVDESNRALLARVYALEDERSSMAASAIVMGIFTKAIAENIDNAASGTDAAYQGLERSIAKQKQAIDLQSEAAQESINTIKSIFDLLKGEVEGLYQIAGAGMSRAAAGEFLKQAIGTAKATGYLPDIEQLGKAIGAAKSGMEPANYGTAFELRRDRLLLANQLAELQAHAGAQLSTAELQLVAAQDQLLKLDAQLEAAKLQIDTMRGINNSILSVGAANSMLSNAILSELHARSITAESMRPAPYVAPPPPVAGVSAYGLPSRAFDAFISAGTMSIADAFAAYSPPAFADGGMYGGGLALVGEEGPELINFRNPGMVYTAAQSAGLMGGGEVVAELRALRSEVTDLRYEARATAVATGKSAKLADRWNNEGLTVRTDADSPLDTVVV